MRQQRVARLESMGVSDPEIAEHVGLTTSGLITLKRTPAYKAAVRSVATGVLSQYDEAINEDINFQKERLQAYVPHALTALYDAVTQKQDGKLRIEAARQILDRDGRMAQVSRIGVATKEQLEALEKVVNDQGNRITRGEGTGSGANATISYIAIGIGITATIITIVSRFIR